MPFPARISLDAILATARHLLEATGPDGLTMRALARELRVSAPSLYFHVESREDLLTQLVSQGLKELAAAMRTAANRPGRFRARIENLAQAYIAFASANPQLFTLIFGPWHDEPTYPRAAGDEAAEPVLALAAEVAGPDQALLVSEALWSLVHGYTVLHLAHQFRTNPDHEAGFLFALDALVAGLESVTAPPLAGNTL